MNSNPKISLSGTGFLTPEGSRKAADIAKDHSSSLSIAERAIALCHSGLKQVELSGQSTPEEQQRLIACVVLARLLESAEAAVLLARHGMNVELQSSVRNLLEALFIFGNACKEPAFIKSYFRSDLAVRHKLILQARKYSESPFALTNEYATEQVFQELKEQIAAFKAQELKAYDNARGVGAEIAYDSSYRVLSAATHSTPRAIGNYVTEELDGTITAILRGPQREGVADRLHDVTGNLLQARRWFEELFALPSSAGVDEIRDALQKLPPTHDE